MGRKITVYFDESYKPQEESYDPFYSIEPFFILRLPESLQLPKWLRTFQNQGFNANIRRKIPLMIKNKRLSCEELPHVKI